jgi:hypothetical protein
MSLLLSSFETPRETSTDEMVHDAPRPMEHRVMG